MSEVKSNEEQLRAIVKEVVDWNRKYPSSRIYSEGDIRGIAKEMDAISARAEALLSALRQTQGE